MKRYVVLFVVVVVAGLALAGMRRAPSAPDPAAAPIAATPAVEIAIELRGNAVSPQDVNASAGARVRLTVVNRDAAEARLVLAGYEDRVSIPPLAAGETWSGEFMADLPGEDFAWTLNGRPAGIFRVTGSHLVEGHR